MASRTTKRPEREAELSCFCSGYGCPKAYQLQYLLRLNCVPYKLAKYFI